MSVIGTAWATIKSKITAGVAAAVIVAGTLVVVNQPGHEAQIGLIDPTTKDTLWAVDSADLDYKYDSLVVIGHIVVVPGEYVYAYSKRGDIISSDAKQSLLNGYVIEVIDPADEGWHNSIAAKQKELHRAMTPAEMEDMLFPTAGKMRKAYSIIRAKRGSALAAKLLASTVPTDTSVTAEKYRPKSGFVDYTALEKAMNVQGLKDKANSPDVMEILDGDKIPANVIQLSGVDTAAVIKDAKEKTPEAAHDFNVISKGEYTCGSGGAYATVTAFMADITTMDSALTGVVISSHTITATATTAATATGFVFTLRNHANGNHGGVFGAGYIISVNGNVNGIDLVFNDGTVIVTGISMLRITTAAPSTVLLRSRGGATLPLNRVENSLFSTGAVASCDGVTLYSGAATSHVSNCAVSASRIGVFVNMVGGIIENSTAIAPEGFKCAAGLAATFRNCVASSATTGFGVIAAATGYNNASTDTTCSNASWATGSGNRVSIVAANEFHSIDPASALCGRLKKSVLWNGGTTPTYSGTTDLAGRARPGQDGGYAIGAYEYHWLSAPGLVGIAPNYARGDSTRPLPDTTGDQIKFWFTGDSVKTDKFLNLIGNDTGVATGAAIQVSNGKVGKCLQLSDTGVVTWADNAAYRLTGQFTIMSWFKSATVSEPGALLWKTNSVSANSGWGLYQTTTANSISMYGGSANKTSSNVFGDTAWARMTFVNNDSARYYKNGVPAGVATKNVMTATTHPLTMGWGTGLPKNATYYFAGLIDRTILADTGISTERRNTYFVSNRELPGIKDTTTTGLLLVDTVGLGSAGADTIAFAVGDTTTWRKFKVRADKVYDVAQYLTNNAANNVFVKPINTMGSGGVTAYSVHAAMPLGGNGSPLRMGIGIFLSQLYKGVRHELAQVSSEISARVSGSILVRLRRERRPVCQNRLDLRAEGHIPHARLHGNERM